MSQPIEKGRDAIFVLFARVPRVGEVKTRLAAALGPEAALALHRAFLLDTIELMHRASARGVQRAIWFSEAWQPDAEIETHLGGFLRGVQDGEDLGTRMRTCLSELLAAGWKRVVIVGVDSPSLPQEILNQAVSALKDREVVLGPALDGGYYVVGARTVTPEMFRGIAWGGSQVLSDTLEVLKILGMAPVLLPKWYDVDTVEDLDRLASDIARLAEAGEPIPRATARALQALDRPRIPS